jgi:hypothetical protein
MNARKINSNTSLVKNGNFEQSYESWEVVTPGVGIKDDAWEGNPIRLISLSNGGKVFQTIEIPIDLDRPGTRYHLRFLYQNTYKTSSGTVIIGKNKPEDPTLEIELPAGGILVDTDPLALTLVSVEQYLPLGLAFKAGDSINVTLISPKKNPGDSVNAAISLTRIELHVELDSLKLVTVSNDDQLFAPDQVLHLCLGATEKSHTLTFEVEPDNPWTDTPAAVWIGANPLEAIVTSPALGINQKIELPWHFNCPDLQGSPPYLFDLNIYSMYTADPFTIPVSLGHHRLVMNVLKGADFFPVLEYGQKVLLEVEVRSFYTQLPISGQKVTWRWGIQDLQAADTDGEGKASLNWQPDAIHEGVQRITASVSSPYYDSGDLVHTFEIRVLKEDPWKAVHVQFEGMAETLWGERSGYPDRGAPYPFTVRFPEDSALQGTQVALCWSEGHHTPGELAVTADPDFEELVDVTGDVYGWTLDCGDQKDAVFGLYLTNPALLRDSRNNAMSLAHNKLKIGEVRGANKDPVVDESDSVYCMVQVLTLSGEPAVDVQVDWVCPNGRFTSYTGIGGWASMFDIPSDAGEYTMEAHIQAREDAPPLIHSFPILALQASGWQDDIDFLIDGKPYSSEPTSFLFRRGKPHTFEIIPKYPDSLFIGKEITLDWRKGVNPDLGLVFDPPLGRAVLLTSTGIKWEIVSGTNRSGLFELEATSAYLQQKRELTGRLMAEKFDDEVTLVFDQTASPIGRRELYPCIGKVHQLTLLPNAFSPLQGILVLYFTESLPGGIVITPEMRTAALITAGGVRYVLDCPESFGKGRFNLFFEFLRGPRFKTSYQYFQLDHNKLKVSAVRKAAVDPVLSKGERARLGIQYRSLFTERPVVGKQVQWDNSHISSVTDSKGWAWHDYEPKSDGLNQIRAQVLNPYDGSVDGEHFSVNVLKDDPWKDLEVVTDDQSLQPWDKSAMFPRHNTEFNFSVSVNEDSYLRGQQMALGLAGASPNELGLKMGPVALGKWQPFDGDLHFTSTAGAEKDESFNFRFAASRLLELSPPSAVSLGTASKAMKLSGLDGLLKVVDWGTTITAQVTLESTLTGKPIVGMRVIWESEGNELSTTHSNFYGVARFSFTPRTSGSMQLTARAGDETASQSLTFSYVVNEPRKMLEMGIDHQTGFPGDEVSAYVLVVSSHTGEALQDVEVEWRFKGVSLKPTITDGHGKASIKFSLPEGTGHHVLIASVGGAEVGRDAISQFVELLPLPPDITELTLSTPAVFVGSALTANSRVTNVPPGTEIVWSFSGLPESTSVTDDQGMTTQTFIPTQIPDNNFADVTATVYGGTDDALTLSTKVCVSSGGNPVRSNSGTFVNESLILLPLQFRVRMRQNRDIAITIRVNKSLVGSDLAIFCTQANVTFDPPAGEYHKVDEWFAWTMNIQAPVGADFVAVIGARGVSGSTGVRCLVIEQGTESAPDFFIEPDDR